MINGTRNCTDGTSDVNVLDLLAAMPRQLACGVELSVTVFPGSKLMTDSASK
jgi:hypothetical protein